MSFLSPNFLIKEFKIGTISDASCLNMGNNWPTQFESHKKQNQGFGSITGDENHIEDIRALLNDPDFIDQLKIEDEDSIPDWLEEAFKQEMKKK